MNGIGIEEVRPKEKGRVWFRFDNRVELTLYRSEIRSLSKPEEWQLLHGEDGISEELYQKIIAIVTLRAKKRTMHLLEQMDRTEYQLREKLQKNGYPQECIDTAIDYVKQFHYVDDLRYAKSYVRYHQEKKSRQRLSTDLMRKGVGRDLIALAIEEEFESDEMQQICELLEKRHYDHTQADDREKRRMYQFLMRRGFKSRDILSAMGRGDR